jgi:hypothetical protein
MELPIIDAIVDNCAYSGKCLTLISDAASVLKTLTEESTAEEKLSVRNRILANDGIAGEFFGTISTQPIVSVEIAVARGLKEVEAGMIIQQRDAIRLFCLELVK